MTPLLLAVGALALCQAAAEEQDVLAKFLVVGDWGRLGELNQSEVGRLMGAVAERFQPEFVVGTGDNFYPSGLSSPEDPAFEASFIRPYRAASLQVPWYSVLGNHDYGDKCDQEDTPPPGCGTGPNDEQYTPLHQLGPGLQQRDWRWHAHRSHRLSLAGGRLELFLLDTVPFIDAYRDAIWANRTGGLSEQDWRRGLAELDAELAASSATWRVVVGHHPPRSNGHHGTQAELLEHLEPVLQRHGVQVMLCGHDHNLEHLVAPGGTPHYVVSGAGSKTWRPFYGQRDSHFQWPSSGFVVAEVTEDRLRLRYFGLTGVSERDVEPLYTADVPISPSPSSLSVQ